MSTATLKRGNGYWIQDGTLFTSLASDPNADWGHYIGQYRQDYWNEKEYAAACVEYTIPSVSDKLLSRTISLPCVFHERSPGTAFATLSTTAPSGTGWRFGPTNGVISDEISFSHTDTTLNFNLTNTVWVSGKTIYLYLYQKNKGYGTNGPWQPITTSRFDDGKITYSSPYTLSINADDGSVITVNRTSSGSGNTGTLNNGMPLYYGDKLKISFSPKDNYRLLTSIVNGSTFVSGSTHTVAANVSIEAASQPLSSGVTATDANIESTSSIIISKHDVSYLHTLTYEFEGLSGTIAEKTSNTNIGWTIPASFYAKIPSKTSAPCVVVCETYSSSGELLGVDECTITVSAAYDKCKPSVQGTVVDTNDSSLGVTGKNTILIRYLSNALCTISATGNGSATIEKLSINGTVVESDSPEIIYNEVEATSFVFSATDSRGYTTEVVVSPEVIPYVKLTINPVFSRPSATSGEILLTFDGKFYNGTIGDIENELVVKYRYRKTDEAAYGDWTIVDPSMYATGTSTYNTTSAVLIEDSEGSTTSFGYKDNFEFQVQAYDGDGATTLSVVTITVPVLNGQPVFDWGASDFKFNVPVFFAAGCGGMVTLWKNEFPDNEFAAQTIYVNGACNIDEYPYLLITSQRTSVFLGNVRGESNLSYWGFTASGVATLSNRCLYIDNGSIKFEDNISVKVTSSSTSGEVQNAYNRPYAVIGIKAI